MSNQCNYQSRNLRKRKRRRSLQLNSDGEGSDVRVKLVKLTTDASKRVCGSLNQSAEGMLVLLGRKETKNK